MVARIIKLSTNLVLSLIFLSILGASFVATIGLSPDSLEVFSSDTNVLGASTNTPQDFLEVSLRQNGSVFKSKKVEEYSSHKYIFQTNTKSNSIVNEDILTLTNTSESIKSVRIKMATSDENKSIANFGIEANGSQQLLINEDYDLSGSIIVNVGPNQSMDLKAFVEFKKLVNFPIEFELELTSL